MKLAVLATKRQTFTCVLPFSGFYCTHHDQNIDDAEEQLFHDDNGNVNSKLYEMFWDNVDHHIVYTKYAKQYTAVVADVLGVQLEYEELVCPREYNFHTDRIFAKLSRQDFCKLLVRVRGAKLKEVARELFASRSGFCSFYSPCISHWGSIDDWDHNHVMAVVEAAWRLAIEENEIDVDNLVCEQIPTESIQEYLCGAANDKAMRALKINDYLRERAEIEFHIKAFQPFVVTS